MSTRLIEAGSPRDRRSTREASGRAGTGATALVIAALAIGAGMLLSTDVAQADSQGRFSGPTGAPVMALDPDHVSLALSPGESGTRPIEIGNTGAGILDWNVFDQNANVNDFRRDSAIALDPLEYYLASAVIDPAGRFAYFGTSTPPGQIVKIDLATFERIGAITLQQGENDDSESFVFSGVIDPAGHYAYFGTGTYPGKVVKIDLDTFERVGALTLNPGEDVLRSAVIDPAGTYAYFGTDTEPVHIVKVDLASLARVGAVDLEDGMSYVDSAATIDPAGAFAYFGVGFGTVAKIDLASFELAGSIDTGVGTLLSSALIDPAGQSAYFGTGDAPGRIVKIDLASFALTDTLTLEPGEDRPAAAVMSADGTAAYFGTKQTSPGRIVRIDLTHFTRSAAIALNAGEDDVRAVVMSPVDHTIYVGTATSPGRVVRIRDDVRNCSLPAWASATPASGSVAAGASQALDIGVDATGSSIGRHEATLCVQSNDPATPVRAVPLSIDVRWVDVSPLSLAIDVVRGGSAHSTLSIANRSNADIGWTIAQVDPVKGCDEPATATWLGVSPTSGTLAPDATTSVGVDIDAADLAAGTHAAQLCVIATDATSAQTSVVAVAARVSEPLPAFAITPGSLSISVPAQQSATQDLSILNTGDGVLDWMRLDHDSSARLDDLLYLADAQYPAGAAVITSDGRYAYFGTSASPAEIVRIDLATFEPIDALTLAAGEDSVLSATIDPAGHFAYFATGTTPGRIVRIDLDTFQRVDAVVLDVGEDYPSAAAIDPAGEYAYFGTRTDPGYVVKIDLGNFARVGSIALDGSNGEAFLQAAAIDPAGAYAYFGAGPLFGTAVKVDLATFQRVAAVTLSDDEGVSTATIDARGRFAYFGTSPPFAATAGRFVKFDLATFEPAGVVDLELANYEAAVTSAVIDPTGRFAYLATSYGSATRLVEIDLTDFVRVGPVPLGVAEGALRAAVVDPAGRFAYFGGARPSRVFKVELAQSCVLPGWLTTSSVGGSVAATSTEELTVGASADGLALGVYSANLCFASNDPTQSVLSVPVSMSVVADDVVFANGFDPIAPQ